MLCQVKMLIPFHKIYNTLKNIGINITGILHVGAHECEELIDYKKCGIKNIHWIEANEDLVKKLSNVPNVYCATIGDEDGREVIFNVTNNYQSSSILELEKHKEFYPHITVIESRKHTTRTLKSIYNDKQLSDLNFWNLDIQGAELMALKGAGTLLEKVDAIYTEVNTADLYSGCCKIQEIDAYLSKFGFKRIDCVMTSQQWGDALYVKQA